MTVEKTNDDALRKTGWKPAEAFQGKAADGQTGIYICQHQKLCWKHEAEKG